MRAKIPLYVVSCQLYFHRTRTIKITLEISMPYKAKNIVFLKNCSHIHNILIIIFIIINIKEGLEKNPKRNIENKKKGNLI